MRIILAAPRGFCPGVNMAIEAMELAIEAYGTPLYVYHEIVHNKWVVDRFRQQGVVFVNDLSEVPEGSHLLYSAHGVSPTIRREAARRRLETIDATCPLVTKVHLEAIRFARQGYTVILIGHAGHDEVVGTMGEALESIRLVQTAAEVENVEVPDPSKVAYLSQTTLSVDDMVQIIERLRRRFPLIVGPPRDDICYATQNRQETVRALAPDVDTVLVVGSRNSSNSQRLAELARSCGVAAHLIDGPADIDLAWFAGKETVMITAGAAPRIVGGRVCGIASRAVRRPGRNARRPPGRIAVRAAPTIAQKVMKINDLEFYLVSIGQTESSAPVRSLLLRITTTAGLEGWGESGLAWRAGELAAHREAVLAVLAGRSVYDIEELHTVEALAPPPLRSAVEMAVWDLLGRTLRQPLCNLLGGYYRRRVPVSMRLPGRRAGMVAQVSRELAEQGFHMQTLDSSDRPDDDLRTLAAIREIVGDRIEMRLDGMRRYDLETARDVCAGLESYNLQFLLDPLSTPDVHPVASLARQTSVPLALGRAIRAPSDALAAVRSNAAAFLVIDAEQVGGIIPARACASIAAAGGVVPLLGIRPSLGIATAAMLHLAAAISAFSTSNDIAPGRLRDTLLHEQLEIADGLIAVPEIAWPGRRSRSGEGRAVSGGVRTKADQFILPYFPGL